MKEPQNPDQEFSKQSLGEYFEERNKIDSAVTAERNRILEEISQIVPEGTWSNDKIQGFINGIEAAKQAIQK